jgi:hypothetical protein
MTCPLIDAVLALMCAALAVLALFLAATDRSNR